MKKTIFLGLILLLVALLMLLVACSDVEPGVENPETAETAETVGDLPEPEIFPDANLQDVMAAAMIEIMDKDTWEADEAMVKQVNGSNLGITDLTGMEMFTGLTHLYFKDNQITDISPLSRCFFLQELSLWNNKITDISPLDDLTSISYLFLADNQIEDVSALSNLTKLHFLDLRNNKVADITSIASLSNLAILDLRFNDVKDISPLTKLTNLNYLYLDGNQISDISPLVANAGLGNGDMVSLIDTKLDLKEGSGDMANIRALEERGVVVKYVAEEGSP